MGADSYDEPDFPWKKVSPIFMTGTLTITGLQEGQHYAILRWDDYRKVPTDGSYLKSKFDHSYAIQASSTRYVFTDPITIESSGTTYYRCVHVADLTEL